MDIEYDVATDRELHDEGAELLKRYNVVFTGSHPEYYSTRMLDAWEEYLAEGGRGMYLGSNGFYWIIAWHPEKPYLMEVRKAELGSRAWQAKPGEYYMQTNGERSGVWRGRARAPQKVFGTGFTAEGFDHSSYYVQLPDARDPAVAFIMDGIGPDEKIGDFGLVGGGAAGYELDRYDLQLGTPPHTRLLAYSEGHSDNYPHVVEEIFFNYPARRRHDGLPGAGRHHLLHDAERRRRVLHQLDLLVRKPLAQRLRQQRLADDRERPAPVHGPGAAAAARPVRTGRSGCREPTKRVGPALSARRDAEPLRVAPLDAAPAVAQAVQAEADEATQGGLCPGVEEVGMGRVLAPGCELKARASGDAVADDHRDRGKLDRVRARTAAVHGIGGMALVVGAVEAPAVPAVREPHVETQPHSPPERAGGDLARRRQAARETTAPGGDPPALRARGLRIARDHPEGGRKRLHGLERAPPVVDGGAERLDDLSVRGEQRRHPVGRGVSRPLAGRPAQQEARQRRVRVRRRVAEVRVVVRRFPGLSRETR